MGRPSRTTMAKRNRERARQEKQQEKAARKQQRRMEKAQGVTSPDADGGFQDDESPISDSPIGSEDPIEPEEIASDPHTSGSGT